MHKHAKKVACTALRSRHAISILLPAYALKPPAGRCVCVQGWEVGDKGSGGIPLRRLSSASCPKMHCLPAWGPLQASPVLFLQWGLPKQNPGELFLLLVLKERRNFNLGLKFWKCLGPGDFPEVPMLPNKASPVWGYFSG